MQKLNALRARIRSFESVVVCFSGGVDSALVVAVAHEELGTNAIALTAASPSLPASELDDCLRVANRLGARHVVRHSREMDQPGYVANGSNRCFFCKTELYRIAHAERVSNGFRAVANGLNLDDLGDHRPGMIAAKDAQVESPLIACEFTKQDVREAAQLVGLGVWDKPASACLASRIPYGTAVTQERLERIAKAEAAIRGLGFRQIRVRLHDTVARVEVHEQEIEQAFALRTEISRACKDAGFLFATLDLDGYRTGSLNAALRLHVVRS